MSMHQDVTIANKTRFPGHEPSTSLIQSWLKFFVLVMGLSFGRVEGDQEHEMILEAILIVGNLINCDNVRAGDAD
jgi:hypothetical protein